MSQHPEKYMISEMSQQLGTLLAPFSRRVTLSGRGRTHHRRASRGAHLACLVVLGVFSSGCVVFPEVGEPPAEVKFVGIRTENLDPSALEPALVDRSQPFARFEADTAVKQQNISGPIYYSWYYDYDDNDNIPLPFYSLCGDTPRCLFSVCAKKDSTVNQHRLLLVVSDTKLKDEPNGPLDFPDDAHFDAVQWQLSLTDKCP